MKLSLLNEQLYAGFIDHSVGESVSSHAENVRRVLLEPQEGGALSSVLGDDFGNRYAVIMPIVDNNNWHSGFIAA